LFQIYVWEGKGATKGLRDSAKAFVTTALKSRPAWTLSLTFKESQETLLFRLKFSDWPEAGKEAEIKRRAAGILRISYMQVIYFPNKGNARQRKSLKSFDIGSMFAAANSADGQPQKKKADAGWNDSHELVTVDKFDDGKGVLQVWIVNDKSKLVQVDPRSWGQFFTSECYVMSYVWIYKEKKRCQLYCWQGRSCKGVWWMPTWARRVLSVFFSLFAE